MHLVLLAVFLLVPTLVGAAETEFVLSIREHRFYPSELRVPSGKKIRLIIDNQDATAEEFESHELNREKVIPGKTKLPVFIGPLSPGRYPFYGEFNAKSAQGVVIAE